MSAEGSRSSAASLSQNSDAVAVHVAEFVALRDEIQQRTNRQWTLFTFNLTLVGTVGGFVLADAERLPVIALLALFCPCLGMLFLEHGGHIAMLGNYIGDDMAQSLQHLTGDTSVLRYEKISREYQERGVRWVDFLLPVFVAFAGPSGASLWILREEQALAAGGGIFRFIGAGLLIAFTTRFVVGWPIGRKPIRKAIATAQHARLRARRSFSSRGDR